MTASVTPPFSHLDDPDRTRKVAGWSMSGTRVEATLASGSTERRGRGWLGGLGFSCPERARERVHLMSERCELEYAIHALERGLKGLTVQGIRVEQPAVLRIPQDGRMEEYLLGRAFSSVARHGSWYAFAFAGAEPLEMLVAPMLTGRFGLDPSDRAAPGDLALVFKLSDGRELRYRDDNQQSKVYVLPAGARARVPNLGQPGLDVLDPKIFSRVAFRELARRRRDPVKIFLMDQSAVDFFGHVYADEVLFDAGIHPTTRVGELKEDRVDKLHDAAVSVLLWAREEHARRKPPLDEKMRDFLRVRNRFGQPCQRCSSKIRIASVRGYDSFFCPTCQPLGSPPSPTRPTYID
jgi:formamidopyrimidine-DNA glycosylase